MLSGDTLARVSVSYRRGYTDGYFDREFANEPIEHTDMGIPMKPFSDHDYRGGFDAGVNDRAWQDVGFGELRYAVMCLMRKE